MCTTPPRPARRDLAAFTLIEMLVVISIIAILMGLAFPAFQSVQNSAKRTQAKNDITQIVTAVNAFYTEYGRYPVLAGNATGTYDEKNNDQLFNVLTARADQGEQLGLNPKRIQFIIMPTAKNASKPVSGQAPSGPYQYKWVDPWGMPYFVRVDFDYDNNIPNPYSSNAGFPDINVGCISWSLGKDSKGGSADKNSVDSKDDILSWQ